MCFKGHVSNQYISHVTDRVTKLDLYLANVAQKYTARYDLFAKEHKRGTKLALGPRDCSGNAPKYPHPENPCIRVPPSSRPHVAAAAAAARPGSAGAARGGAAASVQDDQAPGTAGAQTAEKAVPYEVWCRIYRLYKAPSASDADARCVIQCASCEHVYCIGVTHCLNMFCKRPITAEGFLNVLAIQNTKDERMANYNIVHKMSRYSKFAIDGPQKCKQLHRRALKLRFDGHADRYDKSVKYALQMAEQGIGRVLAYDEYDKYGKATGRVIVPDQSYVDKVRWETTPVFRTLVEMVKNDRPETRFLAALGVQNMPGRMLPPDQDLEDDGKED